MAYIAFRFRLAFGVGAMAASMHDVLITLSFLTIASYELSLNVVAAILTLIGYGVNDQIVIFDRVRENLRDNRREPLERVINKSVNQTLPPHHHHGRHDVPVGAGAVSLRRRGARSVRVRDAGRASSRAPTRPCSSPSAMAVILSGKQAKGRPAAAATGPASGGRKAS